MCIISDSSDMVHYLGMVHAQLHNRRAVHPRAVLVEVARSMLADFDCSTPDLRSQLRKNSHVICVRKWLYQHPKEGPARLLTYKGSKVSLVSKEALVVRQLIRWPNELECEHHQSNSKIERHAAAALQLARVQPIKTTSSKTQFSHMLSPRRELYLHLLDPVQRMQLVVPACHVSAQKHPSAQIGDQMWTFVRVSAVVLYAKQAGDSNGSVAGILGGAVRALERGAAARWVAAEAKPEVGGFSGGGTGSGACLGADGAIPGQEAEPLMRGCNGG